MIKLFSKQLKGSFTIEITYILAVVFISIITLFSHIYKEYASTSAGYIMHYNANTLLSKYEGFGDEFSLDNVKNRTGKMLADINILKDAEYSIEDRNMINAELSEYNISININEINPIEFMRKCAVLEDMYERNKNRLSTKE